jgi:hypothetical protein
MEGTRRSEQKYSDGTNKCNNEVLQEWHAMADAALKPCRHAYRKAVEGGATCGAEKNNSRLGNKAHVGDEEGYM